MVYSVFALALAGHLFGDFLLQTDKMAEEKKRLKAKAGRLAMLKHSGVIFAINIISFYLLLGGWWPLAGAAAVFLAHLCIDSINSLVKGERFATMRFVLDQALHIAVVAAITHVVYVNTSLSGAGIYHSLQSLFLLPNWSVHSDQAVWTIAAYFGCVWGGAYLIRALLKDLDMNFEEQEETARGKKTHAGKWIGILERTAIVALIPLNQWAAVGLLLTAKSIARHKYINEKSYAEYYLIGTLLSFLVALGGGLLISGIWAAPVSPV